MYSGRGGSRGGFGAPRGGSGGGRGGKSGIISTNKVDIHAAAGKKVTF